MHKKTDLQKGKDENEVTIVKDTPGRSLAKAISWRLVASLTTFLITFVIFRQKISGPYKQILEASTLVMIFDVVIKIVIYYFHERLWTNISWGKYMQRRFWKRRAWKKLYRKMHASD
ncbi:MAG: DUF2061 domain-containing protein [Bacteroidetes bacterium]|nr:DUF2061 domain-containing protein [Bacteroidota bacterium]